MKYKHFKQALLFKVDSFLKAERAFAISVLYHPILHTAKLLIFLKRIIVQSIFSRMSRAWSISA